MTSLTESLERCITDSTWASEWFTTRNSINSSTRSFVHSSVRHPVHDYMWNTVRNSVVGSVRRSANQKLLEYDFNN